MNPKRLEKMLPKFLQAVKAQDRVLLVGTTTRPFDANLKPFCQVYQKIILIPRPDYSSRLGKYFKQSFWLLLFKIHAYCLVILRTDFNLKICTPAVNFQLISVWPKFSVPESLGNTDTGYPKNQIIKVEVGRRV